MCASLTAKLQNKYEALHWSMFNWSGRLTEAIVDKIAISVGLDIAKLKQDMQASEIQARLVRNLNTERQLGIQETPAFIAGKTLVPGAVTEEQFKAMLAAAAAQ